MVLPVQRVLPESRELPDRPDQREVLVPQAKLVPLAPQEARESRDQQETQGPQDQQALQALPAPPGQQEWVDLPEVLVLPVRMDQPEAREPRV